MSHKILLGLSVLPSIILGYIVYKEDKVEKEPASLLMKLLFGGVIAAIMTVIISIVLEFIFPFLTIESKTTIESVIEILFEVSFVEEFCKWIILKKVTWNNKEFNYLYDAIVYAVFVSLGFATIENILYVLDGGLEIAILRSLLSVPGHVFYGVFMGYCYGMSKLGELNNNNKIKIKNMCLSIVIPTILHFIFDFCLTNPNITFLTIYLIFIVMLYILAFKKIIKISKIKKSIIPEQIILYCPNCRKRIVGKYCSHCGKQIEKQ